jgi:hypothetical protein
MEAVSLPWSQKPTTGPDPEPDESSPNTPSNHIFIRLHFNIILPSMPRSPSLFYNRQINNEQSLFVQYISEDSKFKINILTSCKTYDS